MGKYIDLHIHSSLSDGEDSPEELVQKIYAAGLSAFALTDHDNLNGIKRVQKAAEEYSLECVPGIELSTDHTKGEVHILGYWLHSDPFEKSTIQDMEEKLKNMQLERNENLIKNLAKLNMPLTYDDLRAEMPSAKAKAGQTVNADEEIMCLPHFAFAMVTKGYVSDVRTALKEYILLGGRAYTPKENLTQKEAIEMLRESHALVSFAHPYIAYCEDETIRKKLIKKLKDYGLQALESLYSVNTEEQTKQSLAYAKEFDLAITGGSDYHGKIKPDIALGVGRGNLKIPYSVLEGLREVRA